MNFSNTATSSFPTKQLSFLVILFLILLCSGISSVNSEMLMNGTQSGKSIVFIYGIAIISTLTIIKFWVSKKGNKYNLTFIDLFLFAFFIYILFRNNWSELKNSLLFIELTGLAILYFILRQQSTQNYYWILVALNTGGLIQAIYGNLQLWGYYPSHHGLFKMTGSFFNPGPYAGYLAAVFPISLGFYLFNISIKFPKQNPLPIKLTFYLRLINSSIQRNIPKSRFFYNKNRANIRTDKITARAMCKRILSESI